MCDCSCLPAVKIYQEKKEKSLSVVTATSAIHRCHYSIWSRHIILFSASLIVFTCVCGWNGSTVSHSAVIQQLFFLCAWPNYGLIRPTAEFVWTLLLRSEPLLNVHAELIKAQKKPAINTYTHTRTDKWLLVETRCTVYKQFVKVSQSINNINNTNNK